MYRMKVWSQTNLMKPLTFKTDQHPPTRSLVQLRNFCFSSQCFTQDAVMNLQPLCLWLRFLSYAYASCLPALAIRITYLLIGKKSYSLFQVTTTERCILVPQYQRLICLSLNCHTQKSASVCAAQYLNFIASKNIVWWKIFRIRFNIVYFTYCICSLNVLIIRN